MTKPIRLEPPMHEPLLQTEITITGAVQGVGFRPLVFRTAQALGIRGFVRNDGSGVFISAVAGTDSLERFINALKTGHPPLAVIRSMSITPPAPVCECEICTVPESFSIKHSDRGERIDVDVTRDAAVCDNCLSEMRDPKNRRYGHPFINCTDCGPRYTIIKSLPYDRPATTMAAFAMCEDCRKEYESPGDRRFHAQPICCPACGPKLRLLGADGRLLMNKSINDAPPPLPSPTEDKVPCLSPAGRGELGMSSVGEGSGGGASYSTSDPIATCIDMLAAGKIVAIKGIGGYHLACRADDETAVARLRTRKAREEKPLAIMVRDVSVAGQYAFINQEERALLEGVERPIVLCRKKDALPLANNVAPGVSTLGIMLPYTPIHHLIFSDDRINALVMTSGNATDEPIAFDNDDALSRLGGIADAFLTHDRDIHVRNDDSIVRVAAHGPVMQRRSRGFVPDPLEAGYDVHGIIALGGVLKSTVAVGRKQTCYLSQYVGEVSSIESLSGLRRIVRHLLHILDVSPQLCIGDLHPGSMPRHLAEEMGLSVQTAQHHHAHAVACMAENGLHDDTLCIVYDGTGYGLDGCVWGGELLYASPTACTRLGHLAYMPLPGAEAAIRHPGRMAVAALMGSLGDRVLGMCPWMPEDEKRAVIDMVKSGVNCPKTSSMGRLFDAASALLGIGTRRTYEGQPAIMLEGVADTAETEWYETGILESDGNLLIDGAGILFRANEDLLKGTPRERIAARFHNSIARATKLVAQKASSQTGCTNICLSGGCFQNALLLERTLRALSDAGLTAYTHRRVPPNDESIAYGQLVIAGAKRSSS
jgi:hydrogenase maturation protein HypF